jgi:aminoglycoside phosphotransferase (APT) family kinase protein
VAAQPESLAAVADAIALARECGVQVNAAVPLRSTNNLVLWLEPSRVVAKIGVGRRSNLRWELEVALELASLGAPAGEPAPQIPAIVHSRSGLEFSFWRYHPQHSSRRIAGRQVTRQLRVLHECLARTSPELRARLPGYLDELHRARAVLANAAATPKLAAEDRQVLAATFDSLAAALRTLAPPSAHRPIHGSPHSYNVLIDAGQPRFIDFETTCSGPVEWDVAYVECGAEDGYGGSLNSELLWTCRSIVSVMTAALCWADVDRGDLREHAEMHLAHVKQQVAPRLALSGSRASA